MECCPECESAVVCRRLRRTRTRAAGRAYVCVADPEHVFLDRGDLTLVG